MSDHSLLKSKKHVLWISVSLTQSLAHSRYTINVEWILTCWYYSVTNLLYYQVLGTRDTWMFALWIPLTHSILCYAELSFMASHTMSEARFMPRYTMSKHYCSFQFQYYTSFTDPNLKQASENKISKELRYSQSFYK